MKKTIDVLTFGDLCVDLILSDKNIIPEFGQKEKMVGDYSFEMGGSCTIFACQTAKLGLTTVVYGTAGEDSFGELIIKTLDDAGVSTEYLEKNAAVKTGITVTLNTREDRAMLTYNGTIDEVNGADVSDELLKQVRHLHIGSYFLMKKLQPYYPEILRKLKEYGATISLDINWDPEEKWDSGISDILPYVDIFLPNEKELLAITRETSIEKAIMVLRETIPIIAVKRGKDGTIVYTDHHTYQVSGFVNNNVVDTIGAGDSFDGGFIYGFLSGKDFEQCARIACLCGSLNTTKSGGIKGQPNLEIIHDKLINNTDMTIN